MGLLLGLEFLTDGRYRHQWIFMTDTVDAIYRPNNWRPEAMLDQLAEIVGGMPQVSVALTFVATHADPSP